MYFFPNAEIEEEALIRFTIAFVISKRKPIYFILLQVKGNFAEVQKINSQRKRKKKERFIIIASREKNEMNTHASKQKIFYATEK